MIGSMGCFAVMVRKKETVLAANAGGKSGFVEVTIVNNFDRVAEESEMKLRVAAMVASNWQNAFAARIVGKNSAAEETIARTRRVAAERTASNSSAVVAAKAGRIRRIVAGRIARRESAAVEMVASNSAAFEGRIANKESAAAAEKLADNSQPPGEMVVNN